MASALNIRNIGDDRKAALEEEAARRGVSTADVVRAFIDEGLEQAQRERAQREWVEAARAGIEEEHARLERNGPSLARLRRVRR